MRTAILMPSGSRFSASRPNSMETVVRTMFAAEPSRDVRIFCCEGATDHDLPNVETLPSKGPRRLKALLEGLRAFQPDVVEHHQQLKQALTVSAAVPEAAHILYRHNALKSPQGWFDRWRYRRRYDRLDGFVFVSETERDGFVRTYPQLNDRAFAVLNPIDVASWLAPVEHRQPVIAFAGRAMSVKGLAPLCEALPSVLDRHPEWRAVLMLNDWDQHHAWAAPQIAPLERYGDRVQVMHSAPLGEVRRVMQSAAIALTPSIWEEPFGLAAVEAHAAGAALISSGRGGLREASGPHALYLRAVTSGLIAEALERLILDPAERLNLARGAQRFVSAVHQPARRAAELRVVRSRVLASLREPAPVEPAFNDVAEGGI